ncbi:MAG: glycerophosphodiester phosphodiesterase family protein [Acetivibrionales bacterium]
MKKRGIIVLLGAVIFVIVIFAAHGIRNKSNIRVAGGTGLIEAPRLIAHAGGEIYGLRLTHSLEALDNSYSKGFRFIEADISRTSDGVPVLVHDWGNANWLMDVRYSDKAPSYKEFKARKAILGLHLMDLDMLAEWVANHDDAYIVTDVKDDNQDILRLIKERYPEVYGRFIPQIYSFDEYKPVRGLGYEFIILTLYRIEASDDEIVDFCKSHSLFALTMPYEKASPDTLDRFSKLSIPVYVHTVNDYNAYIKLRDNGAYGIYTDYFHPSKWIE